MPLHAPSPLLTPSTSRLLLLLLLLLPALLLREPRGSLATRAAASSPGAPAPGGSLADAPCARDDVVGRSWTRVPAAALEGGVWSPQTGCVYAFEAAPVSPAVPQSGGDALLSWRFSSPSGCLWSAWGGGVGTNDANATYDAASGAVALAFPARRNSPVGAVLRATGEFAAGCALLSVSGAGDGADGLYVRGEAPGAAHPYSFSGAGWLRAAAGWVVRAAEMAFPDGTRHLTPGVPVAPGAISESLSSNGSVNRWW